MLNPHNDLNSNQIQPGASRSVLTASVFLLTLIAMVLLGTQSAEATHYRYGHVSWMPGSGTNEILFVIDNAWRLNQGTCRDQNNPTIIVPCTGPGGLPGVGDIHSQGVSSPVFHFGDGNTFTFPGGVLHLVTSIDPVNNWYFGRAIDHTQLPNIVTTISHTYAAAGNYTAFFPDCCRISEFAMPNRHINNPDQPSRIETLVSVGQGNSSPVSVMPPVVTCLIDTICEFSVPATDPGSGLNFRFSTQAESGIVNHPGSPHAPNNAVIDPVTGIFTWNTQGASLGGVDPDDWNVLYSTQVTIEDLDSDGNVRSKVAVDFFIQLSTEVGDPPVFAAPTPGCGTTLQAAVGQSLSFSVVAEDPDGGDITLNVVGLPPSASMDPGLPHTATGTVSSDFSWTPGAGQIGSHVMTFTALDEDGQSAACPLIVQVADESEPDSDCVQLIAGQYINAGEVCVGSDGEYLSVTYTTIDGWKLYETHLAVSSHEVGTGEWLMKRWTNRTGNPAPGRFPHSEYHNPTEDDTHTYTIPLSDITDGVGTGDVLYIAAHAVVHKDDESETAWGDGELFVERGNWAMYFSVELDDNGAGLAGNQAVDNNFPGTIAESYSLGHNYPNPFNPSTTINFTLPDNARVTLEVFNMLGQRVKTLVAGETLNAGYHQVVWNGRDDSGVTVSSGVYLYRIQAGEFNAVKTMHFLK